MATVQEAPPRATATMNHAELRSKIKEINQDPNLTPVERAKAVQLLMSGGYLALKTHQALKEPEKAVIKHEASYFDSSRQILGCKHYQRGCKIEADCCKRLHVCRLCHDETESGHHIDRYATKLILCMRCMTKQNKGRDCANHSCGHTFAKYYCDVCNFWDDDKTKDIYHCSECRICRIGKGLGIDYYHCNTCNACMSIGLKDSHRCVANSLESNCPICSDFMFTSTTPVTFLPCGHCMHVQCYSEYIQTNYVCPLCCKSLGDMSDYFARIDQLLQEEKLPEEYQNWRCEITCCDCDKRSIAKFHFLYHKCGHCASYNTKILRQFQS